MGQTYPPNKLAEQKAFFDRMVSEYSPMLYAHIRSILLNHEDTNDALQNAFIKAWNALSSFNGDAAFSTWMYKIATNEALNLLRKNKWRSMLYLKAVRPFVSENLSFSENKTEEKLQKALQLLTVKQRMVFGMRYFNEVPYSEIAQILNIAEGTAKAVYHQSSKKIESYIIENAE